MRPAPLRCGRPGAPSSLPKHPGASARQRRLWLVSSKNPSGISRRPCAASPALMSSCRRLPMNMPTSPARNGWCGQRVKRCAPSRHPGRVTMTQTFTLPDLGEGIHEAEIQDICVAVGDAVHEDQIILVLETDKAVVEVPSPYSGIVGDIRVAVGNVVHVGEVLMTFGDGTAATTADQGPPQRRGQPKTSPAASALAPVASSAPPTPPTSPPGAPWLAGPVPA